MLFDSYMMIIYGVTLLSVAASILILRLWTDKRQTSRNLSRVIDRYTAPFVWLIAPMTFLFLFVEWWVALLLLPLPSLVVLLCMCAVSSSGPS